MTYIHKLKPHTPTRYSDMRLLHGTIRAAGSEQTSYDEPDDNELLTTFLCEITPVGHGKFVYYNSLKGAGFTLDRSQVLWMYDNNKSDDYALSGEEFYYSMGWRCRLNMNKTYKLFYYQGKQIFLAPEDGSSPYAYPIRSHVNLPTPSHTWWWDEEIPID